MGRKMDGWVDRCSDRLSDGLINVCTVRIDRKIVFCCIE